MAEGVVGSPQLGKRDSTLLESPAQEECAELEMGVACDSLREGMPTR
jgi:hypothetical protein